MSELGCVSPSSPFFSWFAPPAGCGARGGALPGEIPARTGRRFPPSTGSLSRFEPRGRGGARRLECTVAEVPLSYRDPEGQSIELALGRLPAANPERKLGSLFGTRWPRRSCRIPPIFSEALHRRFDLIGFDPPASPRALHSMLPLERAGPASVGADFPITPKQERASFA